MAESEKLSPTLGALKQHILRAQGRVWGQAAVPQQELLDPLLNGYDSDNDSDDGQLQPTTTDVPPAPEAIVEMVRCQCKGNCSSNRCSCKCKNLPAQTYVFATHSAKMTLTRHYNNRESDDDSDG